MELTFTEVPLRNDNNIGNQGHEPDNTLVDYYIKNHRVENRSCEPPLDVYTNLEWRNEKRRITTKTVARFGIKSFPGIGAYGWYHTLHENRNMVVIPINNRKVKYVPPTFTVTKENRQLVFAITQPSEEEIQYDCFRIVIRKGYVATEYITYNLADIVIAPPPGTYEITLMGYLGEDKISEDSEVLELTISSEESWYPDGIEMLNSVTQTAITSAIGSINDSLGTIVEENVLAISANTASINTNTNAIANLTVGTVTVDTIIFTQTTAATTWTINHNLGYFPVCNVVDENGYTIIVSPHYINVNNIEISFAVATAGKVFMK